MFTTVVAQPGLIILERPGLVVITTLESPDDDGYRTIARAQLDVATRDGAVSVLGVIPRFDGPLRASGQVRRECDTALTAQRHAFLGMATAITVTGLPGMLLRAVMTGVQFRSTISRTCTARSVAEGAAWIERLPGQRSELATGLGPAVVSALQPHGVELE